MAKRVYRAPTSASVEGAYQGGVTDPRLLVDASWTPEQKVSWVSQFNALAAMRGTGQSVSAPGRAPAAVLPESRAEAEERHQAALARGDFGSESRAILDAEQGRQRAQRVDRQARVASVREEPPVLRDLVQGVRQGAGDLASLGQRGVEAVVDLGDRTRGFVRQRGPARTNLHPNARLDRALPAAPSEADAMNRRLAEDEAVYQAAGQGDAINDTLQTGLRGAARSLTTAVPLAATGMGPYGVIAGFAASRANQAITEGRDAGLKGSDQALYVGRAALIEGAVAGAFQRIGLGGLERSLGGGAPSREGLKATLKQTFLGEIPEEVITELLDAENQAFSKVTGPVTPEQRREIAKQTIVTTLLTMGAAQGFSHVRGAHQRGVVSDGLAADYGWTRERARGVVDRAADRPGDFGVNLGREVQDEARLRPNGLLQSFLENQEAVRKLAATDSPSRSVWKYAGLPDRPKEERARIGGLIREIVAAYDEVANERRPVAPPSSEQAALAAQLRQERDAGPESAQAPAAAPQVAAPPPAEPVPAQVPAATVPAPVSAPAQVEAQVTAAPALSTGLRVTPKAPGPPLAADELRARLTSKGLAPVAPDAPAVPQAEPPKSITDKAPAPEPAPAPAAATPVAPVEAAKPVVDRDMKPPKTAGTRRDTLERRLKKARGQAKRMAHLPKDNPARVKYDEVVDGLERELKGMDEKSEDADETPAPKQSTGKKRKQKPVEPAKPAAKEVKSPRERRASAKSREAVRLALVDEGGTPLTVAEVAEYAGVSETEARAALKDLSESVEARTEDPGDPKQVEAGPLVVNEGGKWRATDLAIRREANPLNRVDESESAADAEVARVERAERLRARAERLARGTKVDPDEGDANEDFNLFAPEGEASPRRAAAPPRVRDGRKQPADIQAVEVTNLIKRLWKVEVRGPATLKRQLKSKRALGMFTPATGEIRSRTAHDTVNQIHELGHFFDRELSRFSGRDDLSPGIKRELEQLGEDLYGSRTPTGGYRAEGFAEFVREYLSGSADLQLRAPNLYRWWTTEYLPATPKEARKIEQLADAVQLLLLQTPQQAMDAFRRPTRTDFSAERIAASLAGQVDMKLRDAGLPILRAMQATGGDLSTVDPIHHPFILLTHYARSAGGRAKHSALVETVDLHGRPTGPGVARVLAPILAENRLKDFEDYMTARRAIERYHDRGLNPGLSRKDAEAIRDKHESPLFRKVAKDFTDMAHLALRPLVEAGYMTEEKHAKIVEENPLYWPMARRFEGSESGSGGGKGRPIYGVTGNTNLPIHDPISAMIAQIEKVQQVAMQHDVMRAMVHFYDAQKKANASAGRFGVPDTFLASFMSEIEPEVEALTFDGEQLRSKVRGVLRDKITGGIDSDEKVAEIEATLEDLFVERMTVFRRSNKAPNTGAGEDPAIALTDGEGKRRFFQIKPELIPILEGVAHSTFLPGKIGAIVRGATAFTRLGATGLNPTFNLISNTLRDALTATITADYSFQIPLWSTLEGMALKWKDDQFAHLYESSGLGINSMVGQDMDAAARLKKRVEYGDSLAGRLRATFASPRNFVDNVRDVLSQSELGPRLIEFRAAHKAGMDKWGDERSALVLAGAASKDLTVNFTRAGTWSRQANEVIPFFNAAIQSADKLARALGVLEPMPWASTQSRRETAQRTVSKAALELTSVALVLWLLHRDDEDWKELPPHEKWGFLHVYKTEGGSWVRVPLPFEAGAIFAALPVAALEETRSPGALKEAAKVAFQNAAPIDFSSLHALARTAAIAAPIVDVGFNKDWKGAPIMPSQKAMLAEDKVNPQTTDLAKWLAQYTPGHMSPIELDYLLNGYSGGLWRRVLGAPDTFAAVDGGNPSSWPVIGVLFTRPHTSRLVAEFYDRMKVLEERKGSGVATLEELGELANAKQADKTLDAVWESRRSAVASDKPKVEIQREASKLLDQAQEVIRAHNKRDRAQDRSVGLGRTLYDLTDPGATGGEWPAISEQEALDALVAEVRRRGDNARPRLPSGKLTAFGKRQARLLEALRRQPAAPRSTTGAIQGRHGEAKRTLSN